MMINFWCIFSLQSTKILFSDLLGEIGLLVELVCNFDLSVVIGSAFVLVFVLVKVGLEFVSILEMSSSNFVNTKSRDSVSPFQFRSSFFPSFVVI